MGGPRFLRAALFGPWLVAGFSAPRAGRAFRCPAVQLFTVLPLKWGGGVVRAAGCGPAPAPAIVQGPGHGRRTRSRDNRKPHKRSQPKNKRRQEPWGGGASFRTPLIVPEQSDGSNRGRRPRALAVDVAGRPVFSDAAVALFEFDLILADELGRKQMCPDLAVN